MRLLRDEMVTVENLSDRTLSHAPYGKRTPDESVRGGGDVAGFVGKPRQNGADPTQTQTVTGQRSRVRPIQFGSHPQS